jgi:HAMP domain-containing protein
MNLKIVLLALAIAAVVAFFLWALTTGPSLIEIIDNPKF